MQYKSCEIDIIRIIFICCDCYRFPSNYTSEEGDNDDPVHTYAMAENVLDIVVSLMFCMFKLQIKLTSLTMTPYES